MAHPAWRVLSLLAGAAALGAPGISAQLCDVPEAIRSAVPAGSPGEMPYATQWVTGSEAATIPLGVGHLYYSFENESVELPPGGEWLGQVVLPISLAVGEQPDRWVLEGWIVRQGAAPTLLRREALVETGYEQVSFVVLEEGPDGWLRIRYAPGTGDEGTGWTPACALDAGPAILTYRAWGDWLVNEQLNGTISPLFFRADVPGALYGEPSEGERLEDIGADYILYSLEVHGEWMRVDVAEPSDYCDFDIEPVRREGWIRWFRPDTGPTVWYYTRGC